MKKIKKNIIKIALGIASFAYKNTAYTSKESVVKVNLGCGLRCLPGWINVDGSLTSLFGSRKNILLNKVLYKLAGSSNYFTFDQYNKIITTCDLKFYNLTKSIPLTDNYADVIYHSHFLEHLTKTNAQCFLKDCFRSLKPGGLLRISVPDLDYAMKMYQENRIEDMMGLFFFTSDDWDFTAHKYGYNFEHLKEILEKIGFTSIEKKSYQVGSCPDISYLDVYPDHSLFIECRK